MTRFSRASFSLKLAILAAVAGLAGGCLTLGRPFDASQVQSISIGKTTQADIRRSFGEPFRTGVDSGDATWTYVDYHFALLGSPRAVDLVVKFSADGTVKSYAFNTDQGQP